MKTVLVTGADGFIGSHLAESLVRKGFKVRALCQYNSFSSSGWIKSLDRIISSEIEIVYGDVRDANIVQTATRDVHTIYHLAALIAIPYSYQAPESYMDTNIRGTFNILQAARDAQTARVLVTSTSEVYGTARRVPIDESHPRQAQSPYAATKIAADALAESFHRSYSLPVTIVRPFNTYGPRQSARAVIPTIITQLLGGAQEIQLGNLAPTRDLVYVDDTVEGYQKIAATSTLIGEDVNIATETEISMQQLAEEIIGQINPSAKIVQDPERYRPDNSEVFRLIGSAEKLFKHTGWKPSVPLPAGLSKTIDWFRHTSESDKFAQSKYLI